MIPILPALLPGAVGAHQDQRPPSAIGRRARLNLTFAYRKGRTILVDGYAEPPFRLTRGFPEGRGVHMVLASSAPGVFGGDVLEQSIRIGRGAQVRLTSQSAQQVHPTREASAAQFTARFDIEDEGQLQCFWDPVIPFAGARLNQRFEIRVEGDGQLLWSDALMCGRHATGERWMFAFLGHEFTVMRGDTLEYLERYRVEPAVRDVARSWITAQAAYVGTTVVTGPAVAPDFPECLQADLEAINGIRVGVARLDSRLLLVRLLGWSGPAFHAARIRTSDAVIRQAVRP